MTTVDPDSIPSNWLVERVVDLAYESVLRSDLERAQLVDADIEQMIAKAASKGKKKWDEFIAGMHSGDELWFFRNSEDEWKSFSGREGYAIVRDGRIIAAGITARS